MGDCHRLGIKMETSLVRVNRIDFGFGNKRILWGINLQVHLEQTWQSLNGRRDVSSAGILDFRLELPGATLSRRSGTFSVRLARWR